MTRTSATQCWPGWQNTMITYYDLVMHNRCSTYNIFDFIIWSTVIIGYGLLSVPFRIVPGVYWCKSLRLEIILHPDLSVKEIKSVFRCKAHIHVGQAVPSWPAGMHTCPFGAGVSVSRSIFDLMIIRIEPQSLKRVIKNVSNQVIRPV